MRKDAVPIHTIAFEDMLNRKRLRRIAASTHGTHRFVGSESKSQLLVDDLVSGDLRDVAFGMQGLVEGTYSAGNVRTLRAATRAILVHFRSNDPELRALAYQAMLELADGADVGPGDERASLADFAIAQKAWHEFWLEHFRALRGKDRARDAAPEFNAKLSL